jgi:DNA modification methylase
MKIKILAGNNLKTLKTLPARSVQCVVTSPPYYGLRDYGTAKWMGGDPECGHNPQRPDGGDRENRTLPPGRGGMYKNVCAKCGAIRIDDQVGLEPTPEAYVEKLVSIFREVRRVLKDDGTLWLNLGDSYWGGKRQSGMRIKPKDLIGIPWLVAFALRADGWWIRSDIVWSKPNPMPESVRDRPTRAHEYIFLLSKSAAYYYDHEAIKEPLSSASIQRLSQPGFDSQTGGSKDYQNGINKNRSARRALVNLKGRLMSPQVSDDPLRFAQLTGRNKRDVWTVTTKPYKAAHFATFPPDLIEPCILAGSREGDTVLDPFNALEPRVLSRSNTAGGMWDWNSIQSMSVSPGTGWDNSHRKEHAEND